MHGLTKIVYYVIQNQFNTRYPELDKIRMDIYEQQKTCSRKDLHKDNKSQKKKIHLTQKQNEQLFSPQSEFIIFHTKCRFKVLVNMSMSLYFLKC